MSKIVAAIIVLVLFVGGSFYLFNPGRASIAQQTTPQPAAVINQENAAVIAEGIVLPIQTAQLNWLTSGTVAELLVQEGDNVTQGAALARLDTRDLELQLASARVGLQSAQARRGQALEGNATPEQVAAAEASVANAQAQLEKIRSGNITAADIAAAEASVANAQAQLNKARTGNVTAPDIAGAMASVRAAEARLAALKSPSPDKLSAAQLQLRIAEINLQQTRDSASATKTSAELAMRQAVETLTQAQSAYATARQQWLHIQAEGTDPFYPTSTNAQGDAVPNGVNDAQSQQYYDAFVQAESAMRSAEQVLMQAQVAFDNARAQEVEAVQQAEAQLLDSQVQLQALVNPSPAAIAEQQAAVDQAQATLQRLRQGGTPADIAAAQATVQQMQANLQRLQQGGTPADIAAAQAEVDRAQANLQQLTAPATKTDLAILEAAVAQAEQQLAQAELALEKATLRAPIAGTVAALNLKLGEVPSASQAAIVLADLAQWQIETSDLSELSVVRIRVGDPVAISFDALRDFTLPGTVQRIKPIGTTKQGDITYTVVITPTRWDERLRWNMTASVTIEPQPAQSR